jgi:hypothetical protein
MSDYQFPLKVETGNFNILGSIYFTEEPIFVIRRYEVEY